MPAHKGTDDDQSSPTDFRAGYRILKTAPRVLLEKKVLTFSVSMSIVREESFKKLVQRKLLPRKLEKELKQSCEAKNFGKMLFL